MMTSRRVFTFLPFAAMLVITAALWANPGGDEFPKIRNTQNPKDKPPTPQEAVKKITLPDGFRVTLFAGEPDVQQPIGIHLDDRGRLWVAESYTYAGASHGGIRWDKGHRDRVVIFEDVDNDGKFDKRKVFWDQAQNLSSVTTGFGGVWLLCAPHLLFIPDRNGDDIPDGKPRVILDGWVVKGVGHNIVNGLMWGPDGWLYGRHGIMNTSLVGRPGTPPGKRTQLNCSIWRYHPTRKTFEVVTHGTTNPWGLDYDDHGQMFFTNNVIGHLWHVIPGAHYKRMYGEDFNPHVYELIDQHADHYHWDAAKSWTDSRNTKGKHGELGGGHSHVGGMIYLGDNWPDKYRNTIFMCNTHGRRVNNDKLIRKSNGYVGVHQKDILFANNRWFRGIELRYGPDGGVYLSDWTDLGECHDHDGVHRTSGRIYKIVYGKVKKPRITDVAKLSNAELVKLQLHKNDWFVRVARRNLQEHAVAGQNMQKVHAALVMMFRHNPDVTRKLRAMWTLYVTGGTNQLWLRRQLDHRNEHIRAWAVRLLVDGKQRLGDKAVTGFLLNARYDPSGLVRLTLASALQRMPPTVADGVARFLVARAEDVDDGNQSLMLWYGLEPLVAKDYHNGIRYLTSTKMRNLRRFIARRIAADIAKKSNGVDSLLKVFQNKNDALTYDVLAGMTDALQGWHRAPAPKNWQQLSQQYLVQSKNKKIRTLTRNLSVLFGDGRAVAELRKIALNVTAAGNARRAALTTLIANRPKDLKALLLKLVNDRATIGTAVKGLANFDDPQIPKVILNRYRYLKPKDRPTAINTLVARPSYAKALLDAVANKRLNRNTISAYHARQIRGFGNKTLNKRLSEVWGEIRTTPAAKKALISRYKTMLTAKKRPRPNLKHGRLLFQKHCGNCHKLYGEGQVIGADLTGSNRDNLDYLLENLVDPNAVVPVDFKMSVVVLKNGRVLNGVVSDTKGQVVSIQTQTERIRVERTDIETIESSAVSLMPEGLLTPLSDGDVRDLFEYLMSKERLDPSRN